MVKTQEPIREDWKVSEVLGRYPALIEVFVGLSPAFTPLRNPILRRIQSRLVTVGQAARIAGLEPTFLVERLNRAAGLAAQPETKIATASDRPTAARPPWAQDERVAAELDARPLLQRGEEPFSKIMALVARVPVGEVFRLRSTFEPVPLYEVLGKRGFVPWSNQVGPEDWEVWFLNSGTTSGETAPPEPATRVATEAPDLDWTAPDATVTIDVRDLVPPEPMIKILEALESLPPGATLLVHHVRRPMHLYPRLDALGCRYETRDLGPGRVEVIIQKPTVDRRAEEQP